MKYSLIVPAAALGEEKHHRHASMFAPLASEADAKRASPDTVCVPPLHDIEEHPQGMFEPAALCNGLQNAPVLSAAPIPPFYGCGNIWRPTSGGILRLGWGRAGAGMWVGRLEGGRMAMYAYEWRGRRAHAGAGGGREGEGEAGRGDGEAGRAGSRVMGGGVRGRGRCGRIGRIAPPPPLHTPSLHLPVSVIERGSRFLAHGPSSPSRAIRRL